MRLKITSYEKCIIIPIKITSIRDSKYLVIIIIIIIDIVVTLLKKTKK
jgi:hypothetical protein